MWKARELREMAMKGRNLDKIVNNKDAIIDSLKVLNQNQHDSFTRELSKADQAFKGQKENTGHMERLALSYKSEMEYYQKRTRKERRKKNILGGALVVVIILTLIK